MSPPLPGELPELMPSRELEMAKQMMDGAESVMLASDAPDIFFYDNSCKNYRGEDEGLLLVQRDPHQVRPPADTGVEIRRNETHEKHFSLGLKDSPKRSEYNWDSSQLQNWGKICQACRDVFNYYCRYLEARSRVSPFSWNP